jgi:DHA1 family bicyclomycin/chloramphenicol resistance-like MFS transporter
MKTMDPRFVVALLGLLLGIQPVTTDLYLPALPSLPVTFGTSAARVQLTLSVLLIAFGASQLLLGPASDRWGRRPVLLGSLAVYSAAGLVAAFAPSIEVLVALRAVQGGAMGGVVMAARAIVRDLYEPAQGARIMAKALAGLGVLACLSPLTGGLLAQAFGWQATLLAVAAFGALSWLVVQRGFVETLGQRRPDALAPAQMWASWVAIARHPTFRAWTLLLSCSYAGLFTYLATSSFVLIGVLGLTRVEYGWAMLLNSASFIAGTFVCRRLLPRLGMRRAVMSAGLVSLAGGTLLGVLVWAEVRSPWAVMGPMVLFMLAHGVHQPCGQAGAVGPFPFAAGAASALSGFVMMVFAFVMGHWIGWRLDAQPGSLAPLAQGIWFWSAAIALCTWTLVRADGGKAHG